MAKSRTLVAVGFAVAMSTAFIAPAGATLVMDFNAATPGVYLTAPYTEDGITMTLEVGHYDIWGGGDAGTQYVNIDTSATGPVSRIRFDFGGLPFDLVSLFVPDFETGGLFASSNGGSMTLGTTGLQSFSGPEWTDVQWLTLETEGPWSGIDNLTIDPIPEPTTLALLGAGLVALRARRRRST